MYVRLSRSIREHFQSLQDRPRLDVDELRTRIDAHLERARKAAASSSSVDLDRAVQLHRACHGLLATPNLREADFRLVQAACLYFADDEDDEGDFTSMVGLEDDVEVLNYVAASLGREDLAIT